MNTKIRITEDSPFVKIPVPDSSRPPFEGYWVRIEEDNSNPPLFGVLAIDIANPKAKTWLSPLRPTKELALVDWQKGFEVSLSGHDHTANVVRSLLKSGAAREITAARSAGR